jgi:hypothetical protein
MSKTLSVKLETTCKKRMQDSSYDPYQRGIGRQKKRERPSLKLLNVRTDL